MNDDVGLQKARERIERQQSRISRSGSGEPDMPWREHWHTGAHGGGREFFVHRLSP